MASVTSSAICNATPRGLKANANPASKTKAMASTSAKRPAADDSTGVVQQTRTTTEAAIAWTPGAIQVIAPAAAGLRSAKPRAIAAASRRRTASTARIAAPPMAAPAGVK